MPTPTVTAKPHQLLQRLEQTERKPRKRGPTEASILLYRHLTELYDSHDVFKEFAFCEGRRWRFDFAVKTGPLDAKHLASVAVGIEIDGGAWTQGRHTRGKGFIADMEKQNYATLLGWRILRFTPSQVLDGTAIAFIRKVLENHTL